MTSKLTRWRGDWTPGRFYSIGSIVQHDDALFLSVDGSTGVTPGTDEAFWEPMDEGGGGGAVASVNGHTGVVDLTGEYLATEQVTFPARKYGALVAGSTALATIAANSATLDAAVAAAKAAGGGDVEVPHGTFYIKRALVLPSNVYLGGAGRGATVLTRVATSKTLLTVNAAAAATSVTVTDPSLFTVGQGIHLWDTTNFDGWTATTAVVTGVAGSVVTFDTPLWGALQTSRTAYATTLHPLIRNEVDATNWGVRNITLDQAKGANDPPVATAAFTASIIHLERAFRGTVEGCEFVNAAADCISDQGWDGANGVVPGFVDGSNSKRTKNTYVCNVFRDGARHAVHIGTGTEGTFVSRNEMTSCAGYALFYCAYATNTTASLNHVYDCGSGFAGLDGRDFGNIIANNEILDCRSGGFAIEATATAASATRPSGCCTITDNFIRGRAVAIANPDYVIRGNIIDLNDVAGAIGFEVRGNADRTIIEGNVVRNGGAGSYGLYLLAGADDCRVRGNTFTDVAQGATINGVARLIAEGNVFLATSSNIGWNFEGATNVDCRITEQNILSTPITGTGGAPGATRLVYNGMGDNGTDNPAVDGQWAGFSRPAAQGVLVHWDDGFPHVSVSYDGNTWIELAQV